MISKAFSPHANHSLKRQLRRGIQHGEKLISSTERPTVSRRRMPNRVLRLSQPVALRSGTARFLHTSENMKLSNGNNSNFKTPEVDSVDFSIESVVLSLEKMAQYNQGGGVDRGNPNRRWDFGKVRKIVDQYEHCLKYLYQQKHGVENGAKPLAPVSATSEMTALFLSPETTDHALKAMLRCKVPTEKLSKRIRELERCIGSLGQTELTDKLSFRLLEANGKAGNVGRAMNLLSIRKSRGYEATHLEFVHAINSINAAGLYLRSNRNVFLSDKDQPQIDDPTRWLDSILLNMNQRDFPLTTSLANRMLKTYASTGRSGKALHYFYRVRRSPIDDESLLDAEDSDLEEMAQFRGRPVKVRMSMRPPPPYHKIPSQVKGKLVRKPGSDVKQLKLDRESDPDWSPPLTAAISFADSLKQGACGHMPIELDSISYSILISACVNRGSLWRAMHILDEVMPANGVEPDAAAYDTLLWGLARVGDAPTIKEYFNKMHANNITPTQQTVAAIVQGLLNLGDINTAITVVQDCLNQYSVLPPYTTHLKILEFALARGLVYEAKRHVFVIQQIWKWERNEYHSDDFCTLMEMTKRNPKLSKEALKNLFAYFGESLEDKDFI